MIGDKDGLLYWPKFFLDHSSTSFASWLGLLNRGSLRAQSSLSGAGSHFGIVSPTDSNHPGTWLYYFLRPPASAVLPLIYTGASLDWRLDRGSIYNIQCFFHKFFQIFFSKLSRNRFNWIIKYSKTSTQKPVMWLDETVNPPRESQSKYSFSVVWSLTLPIMTCEHISNWKRLINFLTLSYELFC